MTTELIHETTDGKRNENSNEHRPNNIVTSRPLIYTKDGRLIEEWLDAEISPATSQKKQP